MKVLQINTVYKEGGSTGRIVADLSDLLTENSIESFIAFGYEYKKTNDRNTYKIESIPNLKVSILKTRIFGRHGFYNVHDTNKLVKWIESVQPDVIHLHNLHNHYINVRILFEYIKKENLPVVWTLHDCWSFTGWCAYFDYVGCDKWKTHCNTCPNLHEYPYTWFFDRSEVNFKDKKECFTGVNKLTIVTPSKWLASLVEQSFLKEYPVKVINNGVNLDVFKPFKTEIVQNKYSLQGKKVILAMAMGFVKRKGVDYLLEIPKLLNKDEILILVGLDDSDFGKLPSSNCIGIKKTNNASELAEWYSLADVFINPTLEDNFPTTNIEALACGTPVITFNTGGAPESVDEQTGIVVDKGDITGLIKAIRTVLKNGKCSYSSNCVLKAQLCYEKESQYNKYLELYKNII
jgi:glycosyltransferase involved in cell wall biosynthesis